MEQRYLILSNFFYQIIFKFKVANFLISNQINLSFDYAVNVKFVKSPFDVLKSFYLFGFSTKLDNSTERILFSGMDPNFNLAGKKCLSEFMEMYVSKNILTKYCLLNSRNGMSCHVTQDLSEEKSYLEIVERDSFLMHFLCPSLKSFPVLFLENKDFKIQISNLQTIDSSICVSICLLINKHDNDLFIGLSSELSTKSATQDSLNQKCFQEALMLNNYWSIPRFITSIDKGHKMNMLLPHLNAFKNNEIRSNIESLLTGGGERILNHSLNSSDCTFDSHFVSSLWFTHASSKKMLNLTFDEEWLSSKNSIEAILNERELNLEFWDIHPLL